MKIWTSKREGLDCTNKMRQKGFKVEKNGDYCEKWYISWEI